LLGDKWKTGIEETMGTGETIEGGRKEERKENQIRKDKRKRGSN
jgi:hypothetical protein